MKLHASVALGAARTMLREAHGVTQERMRNMIRANKHLVPIRDEATARRFIPEVDRVFGERMVLKRVEFAKKHSTGLCIGLDAAQGETRDMIDLWGIAISSSDGETHSVKFGLRIQHHALQRFQQREAGVVLDFQKVVDEMAPAVICVFLLSLASDEHWPSVSLLPTLSGAILVEWDKSVEAFAGKTWLRTMDLFPNQRTERRVMLMKAGEVLADLDKPFIRYGTYAGRNDSAITYHPESTAKLIQEVTSGMLQESSAATSSLLASTPVPS